LLHFGVVALSRKREENLILLLRLSPVYVRAADEYQIFTYRRDKMPNPPHQPPWLQISYSADLPKGYCAREAVLCCECSSCCSPKKPLRFPEGSLRLVLICVVGFMTAVDTRGGRRASGRFLKA
jgi:hypothetical protein